MKISVVVPTTPLAGEVLADLGIAGHAPDQAETAEPAPLDTILLDPLIAATAANMVIEIEVPDPVPAAHLAASVRTTSTTVTASLGVAAATAASALGATPAPTIAQLQRLSTTTAHPAAVDPGARDPGAVDAIAAPYELSVTDYLRREVAAPTPALRLPETDNAETPTTDARHGGHGGSDGNDGAPAIALLVAADMAFSATDPVIPYRPFLHNRRLETNGVDDALILLTAAMRDLRERHDSTIEVAAPVPVTVVPLPVALPPDSTAAAAPPAEQSIELASGDIDKRRQPYGTGAAIPPRLPMTATIAPSRTALRRPTARTARNGLRSGHCRARLAALPLSDPRLVRAAERAIFQAGADASADRAQCRAVEWPMHLPIANPGAAVTDCWRFFICVEKFLSARQAIAHMKRCALATSGRGEDAVGTLHAFTHGSAAGWQRMATAGIAADAGMQVGGAQIEGRGATLHGLRQQGVQRGQKIASNGPGPWAGGGRAACRCRVVQQGFVQFGGLGMHEPVLSPVLPTAGAARPMDTSTPSLWQRRNQPGNRPPSH